MSATQGMDLIVHLKPTSAFIPALHLNDKDMMEVFTSQNQPCRRWLRARAGFCVLALQGDILSATGFWFTSLSNEAVYHSVFLSKDAGEIKVRPWWNTVSVSWILMSYAGGWRPRFLSVSLFGAGMERMERKFFAFSMREGCLSGLWISAGRA